MKMVMIVYNVGIDGEVMEALTELEITSYTKWPKVLGKGKASGPHLDSHIWPGANCVLLVAIQDDKVAKVLDKVRDLRKRLGKAGIKAFVWPLEEVT